MYPPQFLVPLELQGRAALRVHKVIDAPIRFVPRVIEYRQHDVYGPLDQRTIPLPLRIKLGAAEGLSWVNEIPSVERNNLEQKGYKPSQLLNYLDFSVDLSLGDIIRTNFMKPLWLGYYIHHRSAIFETAQQFGRIKGGSNFQSIALTYEF